MSTKAGQLHKGPTVVAVIRKPGGVRDVDRDEEDPPAAIDELPHRLVEIFNSVIDGVVPRTVVTALAVARDRAGSVISRYTSVADLGFLGEAVAKSSVPDALRQLLDAVQDDAFGEVQRQIGEGTLEALEAHLAECSLAEGLQAGNVRAQLRGESGASKKFKLGPSRWLDGTVDQEGPHCSDLSFGALVQTRIVTGDEIAPILQLGTVVKWPGGGQFGVCLMALCDAARSGSAKFPFAVFSAVQQIDGEKFPISFGSGEEHHSESGLYEGSLKLQDIVFVDFVAEDKRPVTAIQQDNQLGWIFQTGQSGSTTFEFVCELRPPVAFKLAQLVVLDASRFGRYGLDLPEWIREPASGL